MIVTITFVKIFFLGRISCLPNVENKMNCKPLSGAAIEVGIPTIERLRIFNLRYLMERLRVVTAEQREGFLFVVCQCPHGLELLLSKTLTEMGIKSSVNALTGLSCY